MPKLKTILKLLVIVLLGLLTSACATSYKIEGVSDFTQVELQTDDKIIVTTKDNETVSMTIVKIDDEYLYGEFKSEVVKKENIKEMELSRFYSGKLLFGFLGLLLFSSFFSG